ncbi:hypothetical protein [Pragia fontium]|uniref:Uncharacterized protein n=2 Tax=Pragia fontium TaxID=82985 RepID=A0AAJ5BH35_9GAMM|nr:hypothetical protein [Pragia fontium]AKJ42444.1 hypothetical protein QQ39_10375 [Pragia fontium]SFC77529.1 hypothetical protein SAMN02745723_10493 [Pragia fontium DSM 5563 = ATCC 49100]SUB82740.1 Uncharacterised protein [Pragia fontium]VEJ55642.1 Uncharacterised protein [Pragia fontium]GKX61457.1 hypothetical protein SOASR032_00260 [Pragia fontium]
MKFYHEIDSDGSNTDICYSVTILGTDLRASKRIRHPASRIKHEQAKKALRRALCKTKKFIRTHGLSKEAWGAFCGK